MDDRENCIMSLRSSVYKCVQMLYVELTYSSGEKKLIG